MGIMTWVTASGLLAGTPDNPIELGTYIFDALEATTDAPEREPVHYGVVVDVVPEMLSLNPDTGVINSGTLTELDNYVAGFARPPGFLTDETNYASFGSAQLFSGNISIGHSVVFTVRAIEDPNSEYNFNSPPFESIDRSFTIDIGNNWSSDRDFFILNLQQQFYIDGQPVSGQVYLDTQKARGFFPA